MSSVIKQVSPQELQTWNVPPNSKIDYYDGKILVVSDPEPEAPFGIAAKAGISALFGMAVFTHAPLVGVVMGAYAVAKVLGTVRDLYGGDNTLTTRLEQDLGIVAEPVPAMAPDSVAEVATATPDATLPVATNSGPVIATSSLIGNTTCLGAVEVAASPAAQSELTEAVFNPALDLGQNPQSALIVGTPGSGKGMLVSNAVRVLREKAPALKVMMIDPKGDPKERN